VGSVDTGQLDAHGRVDPMPPPARTVHVLFVLRSLLGYLRFYRSTLELLVARGHRVRLLIERDEHGEVEQAWLDGMLQHENFSFEAAEHFGSGAKRRAEVRRAIEYLRVLDDGTDRSTIHFRHRLRDAPRWTRERASSGRLLRSRTARRLLRRLLIATDRALSAPAPAREYVAALRPDVVALCDHGNVGSLHSAYAKAAMELGIPAAICVATWDNLSSRQRMRVQPHALLVWNETQRREAVELHGARADRVEVVGAPNFDDWFTWQPRSRDAFLASIGLDPSRPAILWVGGALYDSEETEAEYAVRWLEALRRCDDPVLRSAGVLLRPHPRRVEQWLAVDVSRFDNAVVWPTEDVTMPVDTDRKADYYDSLYHAAAVVGLNTSAMIEASIVGRPIVTVLAPGFHDSQLGAAHFSYLLEELGGPVRVTRSLDEQFAELAAIVAGREDDTAARMRKFVHDFVRPHGLDRAATPIFVEALERLAAAPVRPEPDPPWVRVSRRPLLALYGRLRRRPERA
jgi:hypothetical protein